MNEIERIKKHYEERSQNQATNKLYTYDLFIQNIIDEREKVYRQIILSHFKNIKDVIMMEIGAGAGNNIPFFNKLGINYKNIFANELIDERATTLKETFPDVSLYTGDALLLNFKNKFDIVFQSTVFTSILDTDFKKRLANKMWQMTKENGIVVWYDFKYNNPKNRSVKGNSKKEIIELFPLAKKTDFHNVTLAPPIGRPLQHIYKLLNTLFPFLRTHVIAAIYK